jgi:hypothetical protein
MSQLDYRVLQFKTPLEERSKRRFEDGEIGSLVGWRHVGIVELTEAQARASLHASGRAVRNARVAEGRFPVVLVLGGPYYVATTAELLASHGFLVAAAFRFHDEPNEVGTDEFSWYLENSVRDAEWALGELRRDARANLRSVSVLGHGGGGAQALLVAMRNRGVTAAVNLDSGNFSTRSALRTVPFYAPRLMRAPYLFIATTATRETQDQFEDFLGMKFSTRFDVILGDPELRHHDLSDFGRAVTAPLHIRGAAQANVSRAYAEVHAVIVEFLKTHSEGVQPKSADFRRWLTSRAGAADFGATVRPGIEPAPAVADVLSRIGPGTVAELRAARERDSEAPLFQAESLLRIVTRAMTEDDASIAVDLADFASGVHPQSALIQALKSEVLESRGNRDAARAAASSCAAIPAGTDWRALMSVNECKARRDRLSQRP